MPGRNVPPGKRELQNTVEDAQVNIHLAYGKAGLDLQVPDRNLARVLSGHGVPPLPDPAQELLTHLMEPTGSPSLRELAARARTACVVVCDITRPVPNRILLPPILMTLESGGIDRGDITILVATGLHRENTPEELKAFIGPDIVRRYRIVNHDARRIDRHRFLGQTTRKTPVFIDASYCSADLKITIGFIEPHLMAGFSGGRKLIAPGCAGEQTIRALHSPLFLEHPQCREGSIKGNPLHEELLEIAGMAGHHFIVDVTLDRTQAVTGIFAGDPLRAHAAGVQFARTSSGSTIDRRTDIVITSGAGYPLDLTFYQAVKGATAALPVVRKGGMLFLVAECAEGLGGPEFTAMATAGGTPESFLRSIMQGAVVNDQWQLEECAKAARHAEVVLVSPRVHGRYAGKLFIRTAATIREPLDEALRRFGPSARVAVIPEGPYTLVEVEQDDPVQPHGRGGRRTPV